LLWTCSVGEKLATPRHWRTPLPFRSLQSHAGHLHLQHSVCDVPICRDSAPEAGCLRSILAFAGALVATLALCLNACVGTGPVQGHVRGDLIVLRPA
jgi:hypothetical protein